MNHGEFHFLPTKSHAPKTCGIVRGQCFVAEIVERFIFAYSRSSSKILREIKGQYPGTEIIGCFMFAYMKSSSTHSGDYQETLSRNRIHDEFHACLYEDIVQKLAGVPGDNSLVTDIVGPSISSCKITLRISCD